MMALVFRIRGHGVDWCGDRSFVTLRNNGVQIECVRIKSVFSQMYHECGPPFDSNERQDSRKNDFKPRANLVPQSVIIHLYAPSRL